MANFGSLWVGRPLSKIEQTCLASFIHHGHSFTLFVYDKDLKVPDGVVKKDANDIIPESMLFKVDNSYAPFADMFRYTMISKTDLTWTDTDNICLKSEWNFPEYLFGMQGGPHKIIANGLLRAPKDSKLVKDLMEYANSFNKDEIKWGEIGPQLLTNKVYENGLSGYIKKPIVFYPVNYWEWEDIFDPSKKLEVIQKSSKSHTLQIWNQMLNRQGIDNNNLPKGSAIEHYHQLYVGDSQ